MLKAAKNVTSGNTLGESAKLDNSKEKRDEKVDNSVNQVSLWSVFKRR